MIGCLRTRVRKQPIITLYFEFSGSLFVITRLRSVDLLFGVLHIGCGVLCLSIFCCALLCVLSSFFNYLEEEERAGCFAFVVLRMSCYC